MNDAPPGASSTEGAEKRLPAPGTSLRCSACGSTAPGSRKDQATFVCKDPDCGWSGNADWDAARNILHLYRRGHALVPAAGRAVVRRPRGVKPATAR
nr:zinc ribbon domain-containing protein [Streptomyces triticiradicis]